MKIFSSIIATVCLATEALAQASGTTLFENVMVFDGRSDALTGPTNVLVEGNVITKVSTDPIEADGVYRLVLIKRR